MLFALALHKALAYITQHCSFGVVSSRRTLLALFSPSNDILSSLYRKSCRVTRSWTRDRTLKSHAIRHLPVRTPCGQRSQRVSHAGKPFLFRVKFSLPIVRVPHEHCSEYHFRRSMDSVPSQKSILKLQQRNQVACQRVSLHPVQRSRSSI